MSIKPQTLDMKESHKDSKFKENVLIKSSTALKKSRINVNKKSCIKKNPFVYLSMCIYPIYVFLRKKFFHLKQMTKCPYNTQLEVFEGSMKYFVIIGKYLGLFPFFPTIRNNRVGKQNIFSYWRYIFSFIICSVQGVAATFCFIEIINNPLTLGKFSYLSFYGTTFLSSVLILRLAANWHVLIKQVVAAELEGYIDPYVKFKCNVATLALLSFALLEHLLSNTAKFLTVLNCLSGNDTVYEQFIFKTYSWVFENGLPYSFGSAILLPVLNIIVAVNWSYSHVFVICISLYLTSIIKQINKRILSFDGQYLSTSLWRVLRQDYNRITRLVGAFDDISNSIVFASFASNLFFICLQLYNVLRHDMTLRHGIQLCPDDNTIGPYVAYVEFFTNTYFVYSSVFVVFRTFIVSLIAAKVHSASLEVTSVLYNVPSPSYCVEVHRFVEQIHGNRVALTGLKFFYVTKELVLSMIGTIVTYELVLLQFT